MKPLLASLMSAALFAGSVFAQADDGVRVEQAWARPTVQGQKSGGAFMSLANGGGSADRLLSGSTPAAERVELHTMTMDGDVMRMRQVEAIDLPPGQRVELKPGGMHLMFMGLKSPLKAGSEIPLTLNFEKAGAVAVQVKVAPVAPDKGHGGHKH